MANNIEALVKASGWRPGIVKTSGGNFATDYGPGLEVGKHSGYGGRHSRWRGEDTMAAKNRRERENAADTRSKAVKRASCYQSTSGTLSRRTKMEVV